jgi:hypothetical protein
MPLGAVTAVGYFFALHVASPVVSVLVSFASVRRRSAGTGSIKRPRSQTVLTEGERPATDLESVLGQHLAGSNPASSAKLTSLNAASTRALPCGWFQFWSISLS